MSSAKRAVAGIMVGALLALAAWPDPARAQVRPKVTVIQTFPSMAFASVYVARAQGFFEAEGVDVDVQIVTGDAVGAQGLVGGTAPMAAIGGAEAVLMATKGLRNFISVSAVVGAITVSVAVRKDVAAARGLTPELPIDQRIAGLKGMRIATGSPGGAIHTTMLYLLGRAGLDPQKDVNLVSVGGSAPMLAALKAGQVDAIAISPPAPEQAQVDGAGVLLISLSRGDLPELASLPYDVLLVHRDYAAKHPDVVRRVARALGRASNVMRDNPELAKASLLKYFTSVPPEVMDVVVANLSRAFPPDGRQSEQMWTNLLNFTAKAKQTPVDLDPREGVLWTNEFITK